MAKKLGYTWYPKDWGNSESVFELSLSERGLYRELIDLAMMNDNKTELKKDVWSRKFCVSIDELNAILEKLSKLNLIKIDKTILFIPSCESRLNMVRGGSKGGKNSKGSDKPLCKGCGKPIHKGECNQREREIENKIENNINERKLKFANTLKPFISKYGHDMIKSFYAYWTEPNKSKTKFKQELEKTWDTQRRLETWAKNDANFKKPSQQQKQSLGI